MARGARQAGGERRGAADAPFDPGRIGSWLERFDALEIVVLGDVVLDAYLHGDVERISPEAPVPVVRVTAESVALGGAGNVARNLVALGARCRLCTVLGTDADGDLAMGLLDDLGVDAAGVLRSGSRSTHRKSRVVARGQQVVRIDRESEAPLVGAASRPLLAALARACQGADGAIVADYGKGICAPPTARRAMRLLMEAGLDVAVDPKGEVAAYRGAALLKPNLREAQALSGVGIHGDGDLLRAAARLRAKIGGGAVAITRGGAGISVFGGERGTEGGLHVPTPRQEVFDVQGAGDTTIAALVLALRAGAPLRDAAVIANAAAGVVVGKAGTATASRDELRAALPRACEAARASAAPRHPGGPA